MLFCYERYADDMVFGDSLTGTRDIYCGEVCNLGFQYCVAWSSPSGVMSFPFERLWVKTRKWFA